MIDDFVVVGIEEGIACAGKEGEGPTAESATPDRGRRAGNPDSVFAGRGTRLTNKNYFALVQ